MLTSKSKILLSIFILILVLSIYYFEIIRYGCYQGYGQLKLIYDSRNIEKIVTSVDVDSETKSKLMLVKKIKQFAIDSLGLKSTGSYTSVYLPTKDTITLSVINASSKLELKNHLWHYPIIGDAPYKGFFNKKLLKRELEQLREKSLDIDVGNVQAWSTLGWFNDPLMGSMLNENAAELSSTIIHELFHATVFVKGESELNENLAEFVGEEGAKVFLKYNTDIHFNSTYFEENAKRNEVFNVFMHKCAITLNVLYNSNLSNHQKLIEKKKLLFKFCVDLYRLNIYPKDKNRLICKRILHSKNAFFTGFLTYNAKDKKFKNELNSTFKNSIRLFINHYKNKYQA